MRLLVSVRSAAEVAAGPRGWGRHHRCQGAGARARLAPVSRPVLREIAAGVPPACRSASPSGSRQTPTALETAIGGRSTGSAPGPSRVYVKLGLSACAATAAEAMLAAAGRAASRDGAPAVRSSSVAYADYVAAGAPAPSAIARCAAAHGRARGVLLDTWVKDGGDLFHHWPSTRCARGSGRRARRDCSSRWPGRSRSNGVACGGRAAGGHRRRSRRGLCRRAGGGR